MNRSVTVTVLGTVVPARTVTVKPQVSGKIEYQHPGLTPGGRFRAGQTLVRLESNDYDLEILQRRAAVSQAHLQLAQERGLKVVADKEWNLIGSQTQLTEEGKRLALREVQVEHARVAVASAESSLARAQLDLARTSIRAPFNAVVTEKFVDEGQVVSAGSPIATLVDADRFWVQVAVPIDKLQWIRVPGQDATPGSHVRIVQEVTQSQFVERKGKVVRLLSDLAPKGKMARLIVEVPNPLGPPQSQQDTSEGERIHSVPLFLGALVTAHINGHTVGDVVPLPRYALRDQKRIWLLANDKKLEMRNVDVVWSNAETVYVRGNLADGERVITSRIATPVVGMALKRSANEHVQAAAFTTNRGETSHDRPL